MPVCVYCSEWSEGGRRVCDSCTEITDALDDVQGDEVDEDFYDNEDGYSLGYFVMRIVVGVAIVLVLAVVRGGLG
jgi:hypothetical protein